MEFKQLGSGEALYVNGKIVDWVCTTIDAKFTYSFRTDGSKIDKEVFETKLEAQTTLSSLFWC